MSSQHHENNDVVTALEHQKMVRRWENLRETYRSVKEAEAQYREQATELNAEISRLESLNASLADEREASAASVAELESLLTEAEVSSSGSAGEMARSDEERAALKEQLNALSGEVTKLTEEKQKLRKKSTTRKKKISTPKKHKGPRGGIYIIRKGRKIYQ